MHTIKIGNYYYVYHNGKKHVAKTEKRALEKACTNSTNYQKES